MPLATASLFHIPPCFNPAWTRRSYRTFCVWISLLSILARIVCDIRITHIHRYLCIVYYPSSYLTPSSSPPVRATVGACLADPDKPSTSCQLSIVHRTQWPLFQLLAAFGAFWPNSRIQTITTATPTCLLPVADLPPTRKTMPPTDRCPKCEQASSLSREMAKVHLHPVHYEEPKATTQMWIRIRDRPPCHPPDNSKPPRPRRLARLPTKSVPHSLLSKAIESRMLLQSLRLSQ